MVEKIENIIDISGLCINCINKECDFIKDIKMFLTNRKSADKIIDANIGIYSCELYQPPKDVLTSECDYCPKKDEF
jgi:hypothetical protein